MLETCDVVVVGGGPSGLQCALDLVKSGLKVVVLERVESPGDPNYSTCGIPYFTKDKFEIEDSCVVDYFDKIAFLSTRKTALFKGQKKGGYVLDFRKFKNSISEKIINAGGEVIYGAHASDIKIDERKKYQITYTKDSEVKTITSSFVVDGTSHDTSLSSKIGIKKNVKSNKTVGEEIIIKGKVPEFYKNNLTIHVGKKYFQHGYGWVFPFGEGIYKVGVIKYDVNSNNVDSHLTGNSLNSELEAFTKTVIGTEYEILERHGGTLFLTSGRPVPSVGGYALTGDAINMCNPMFAEGIRHALETGRMCAKAIKEAYDQNIYDLTDYNNAVNKYVGNSWKTSRIFANLFYHFPFDFARDIVANQLSSLTFNDILELGFNYKYYLLLETIF